MTAAAVLGSWVAGALYYSQHLGDIFVHAREAAQVEPALAGARQRLDAEALAGLRSIEFRACGFQAPVPLPRGPQAALLKVLSPPR